MSKPHSVQQQADEANKHFETTVNPEESAPVTDQGVPEGTESGQQSAQDGSPSDEQSTQDQPKRSESYWENRFNVLQGKYNAEVPALQAKVNELQQAIQERDRNIEQLQSAELQGANSGLTDEQMENFKQEFGEDVVDFVTRVVESRAGGNEKVAELERKVSQFEQRDRVNSEASFWTALEEIVPDYMTVNNDPAFHQFLAQFDPQTGKQRQQALNEAQQALDADGVAAMFNAFKQQAQGQSQNRIPEDQIDPRSSHASDPPQGQHIWTRDEITGFYKDKVDGKYSQDEAQRLEADIFKAQKEGRVR